MDECPTPDKRAYASRSAAKQGIRTLRSKRAEGGAGRIHAYQCLCKQHWHVGHIPYNRKDWQ